MMPYKDIKIGSTFSNPLHRGYGSLSGLWFHVIDKNDDEKMIKIQAASFATGLPFGKPFWKSYRDRMFSLAWLES